MAWIQCSWASLKRNIMPITISKVVIPGHPPELSDDVRLLLIDTWRQVLEIYLVLKSMHWHFLVADTQHYMRLGPSVRPLVCKGRKVEQRAFWILFIYVCVWSGVRSVDGDWMPLPTRPQRYCDPASLVHFLISNLGNSIDWISFLTKTTGYSPGNSHHYLCTTCVVRILLCVFP